MESAAIKKSLTTINTEQISKKFLEIKDNVYLGDDDYKKLRRYVENKSF